MDIRLSVFGADDELQDSTLGLRGFLSVFKLVLAQLLLASTTSSRESAAESSCESSFLLAAPSLIMMRFWITFVSAWSKGSKTSCVLSSAHCLKSDESAVRKRCTKWCTELRSICRDFIYAITTSAAFAASESTSATSISSSSASVSGVGVRCSRVTEEPVFDSDSSVSVGCSDSVSGVGALALSCIRIILFLSANTK